VRVPEVVERVAELGRRACRCLIWGFVAFGYLHNVLPGRADHPGELITFAKTTPNFSQPVMP
jgi:hypothetical protein